MSGIPRFFKDDDLEFVFLAVLGSTYYEAAEVGTCLSIAGQIVENDAGSAFRAFSQAGARLRAEADQAVAAGRRVSARAAYLQAATYTYAATYFVDKMGDPAQFTPTWKLHREAWDRAAALFDPPIEPVEIPYEGTVLHGYFFKADRAAVRRPLLILNNGSDGSVLDMWVQGGAAAVSRGYNCLTFDGPGQGAALHLQGLSFRPDWEKVITPMVDYALGRPDVDPRRIALQGISQGGYWVPRAVAFEQRIAAAIADPGVWDVSTSWTAHLPPPMLELLNSGQKDQFDAYLAEGLKASPDAAATLAFRMRPYGAASFYDAYHAAQQYTLTGVADKIRCPMLITNPDNEQFWPGQSQQLYDALTCPKTLVSFTAAEGGDWHCEPKAPGLRDRRVFDWLDATLDSRGAGT